MRVALLSHNARTGDAVGNQVAAKAAFFRDRGAEVRAYVESDRALQPALAAMIRRVGEIEPIAAVAAELSGFDLICIEYSQYFRSLEVLPLLGPNRPKMIVDYHGVTPPELWDGPREFLRESQRRRGLVWFADEVAVHSQFMCGEIHNATRFPNHRIFSLPLYLEIDATESATQSLRHRLKLAAAKILLFVGRLAANKRVSTLIEAVAKLRDIRPPIHAIIAGDNDDLYANEFQRCRDLAAMLGVSDRVRFLGRVSRTELAAAYQCADVFVMPSTHEGFCVPVIEAMAHGVPVIAARAGALPETLGHAGLSFTPDDADDLGRQILRVVEPKCIPVAQPEKSCFAVVAAQYGDDALGGAESSLRLIAESLAERGHRVTVFTTGRVRRTEIANGVHVHRFPIDPVDANALAACAQQMNLGQALSDEIIDDYFAQTRASSQLLAALESRQGEFQAVIAGPYASGLTWAVAERLADQTILVPCFHDEPLANSPMVRDRYGRVAGMVYHSSEEREFAQLQMGLHHPKAEVIGTWLPPTNGNAERGKTIAKQSKPYVVYCGRYCREKAVPTLIDWLQRYSAEFPDRFGAVFTGRGQAEFPAQIVDLGFLSDEDKTDVFAGAAALVILSQNESLSLVALEAWSLGVPVISHAGCRVLAGHQQRCDGGASVDCYDEFRNALNDLWRNPDAWREKAMCGWQYVQREYGDRAAFGTRLESAISTMSEPLADVMKCKGRLQAAPFTRESWSAAFAEQVERVLHREPTEPHFGCRIQSVNDGQPFTVSAKRGRLSIRLRNTGTVPLLPDGEAAAVVWTRLYSPEGEPLGSAIATRLSEILVPGQQIRVPVRLAAPARPGDYRIGFRVVSHGHGGAETIHPLLVSRKKIAATDPAALDAALNNAEAVAELPVGYTDVTEGRLAKWKRKIKRKLLHQFQTAYVDVLSRQQSAFNRSMVSALRELSECTAMLEREVVDGCTSEPAADLSAMVNRLAQRVRQTVGRITELEQRLARLESLVTESAPEVQS